MSWIFLKKNTISSNYKLGPWKEFWILCWAVLKILRIVIWLWVVKSTWKMRAEMTLLIFALNVSKDITVFNFILKKDGDLSVILAASQWGCLKERFVWKSREGKIRDARSADRIKLMFYIEKMKIRVYLLDSFHILDAYFVILGWDLKLKVFWNLKS